MIVLDTNVVSELMRPQAEPSVVGWVDRQAATDIWLTAVTLAELLYGIGRLPEGHRKADLATRLESMVAEDLDHRIAGFDATAASHYADIVVLRGAQDARSAPPTLRSRPFAGAMTRSSSPATSATSRRLGSPLPTPGLIPEDRAGPLPPCRPRIIGVGLVGVVVSTSSSGEREDGSAAAPFGDSAASSEKRCPSSDDSSRVRVGEDA